MALTRFRVGPAAPKPRLNLRPLGRSRASSPWICCASGPSGSNAERASSAVIPSRNGPTPWSRRIAGAHITDDEHQLKGQLLVVVPDLSDDPPAASPPQLDLEEPPSQVLEQCAARIIGRGVTVKVRTDVHPLRHPVAGSQRLRQSGAVRLEGLERPREVAFLSLPVIERLTLTKIDVVRFRSTLPINPERLGEQLVKLRDPLLHSSDPRPHSGDPCVQRQLVGRRNIADEARQFLESARADGDPFYAAYVQVLVLGLPIEPRNFNRYWDRRCDAAGVRRITIRDARRTCASLLADLDVHPRVAMQILRHDGDLHRRQLGGDSHGAEKARRVPRALSRCCTLLLHGPRNSTGQLCRSSADQPIQWAARDSNPEPMD